MMAQRPRVLAGRGFEITGDSYFSTRMPKKVRIAWGVGGCVLVALSLVAIWLVDTHWFQTALTGLLSGAGLIGIAIALDRNDFTRYTMLIGGSTIVWNTAKAVAQFYGVDW